MKLEKGDIILVHSHNLIGKIIQFGMKLEKWRKLDFKEEVIYNHGALCISEGVISEALSGGITTSLAEVVYKKGINKDIIVYRPKLNSEELSKLYYSATKYTGTRYQFINFLQYIPKILFGVWLGTTHKKSEDRLYCTEYVALVLHNITNGKLFPKYWSTSPNDIYKWCQNNATKIAEFKL